MSDFSTKVTNINNLLLIAAKDGNINEVRRLIEKGADVNANDIRITGNAPISVESDNERI